jgi:hypothetical protein
VGVVNRLKRLFAGGSSANEQLTAIVAAILILLLAIEGATLLNLTYLLTVHAFVGMLLIPVVVLKFASTGWRMLRYYRHAEEYVLRGPPQVVLRVLVSPVLILATIVLFGTGVVLLVRDETHGTMVGLHKASFIVWVAAAAIHVLVHVLSLPRLLRRRIPGLATRVVLVTVTLVAGAILAIETLPGADRLQDRASAHFGFHDDGG